MNLTRQPLTRTLRSQPLRRQHRATKIMPATQDMSLMLVVTSSLKLNGLTVLPHNPLMFYIAEEALIETCMGTWGHFME